ncbi:MAG TPA: PilZ domain-containing protein [Polyangiaceae bacterium]|nr:PilZ domain-containing protein [Polyangiaceae bacterium]
MTQPQERRDPEKPRKTVSTLVEVCGNVPGIPVFEAESIDVSPHGMHLRTAYLPEEGAPLVCRFESDGREIVVEGMVAWRREGGRGGEFGVKFTALDSRSVDALRNLCGMGGEPPKAEVQIGEPGARVRLHIDGLGSPMKARVKAGGSSKVQVGSSLEFLKVGKRLELEDLDIGARRSAEIDGVSVIVDPSTQVPQLVVALRFEGSADSTPSPSVADVAAREPAAGVRIPAGAVTTDAKKSADKPKESASTSASDDEDADDDAPEMRGRLASMAANAEESAKRASETLARAGAGAAQGAASFFKNAGSRLLELRKKSSVPARRTTAPAPGTSAEKPRLRPQSGSSPAIEAIPLRKLSRRTLAIAGGASVATVGILMFALRTPSAPPPGASNGAVNGEVVSEVAPPAKAASPGASAVPNALGTNSDGVVTANVPLFGPTPLATTEPAPLGPPPGSNAAAVEASERADARQSIGAQMNDESFGDESEGEGHAKSSEKSSDKSKSQKPEDVAPWGHGKMHEPTIYRIRLDGPGEKIVGTQEPTGFNVTVPERKVMEAVTAIAKRDDRIARVRSNNGDAGAQLSFRFKDEVPSYRVRLRRDYVEVLISAPIATSKEKDSKKPEKSEKSDKEKRKK